MFYRLLFIFILFFVPFFASAATFYISPTGIDPTTGCTGGTSANPWKTFAKANSCVTAGDTLIVKDGTYTEAVNWTKSGNSGNPITIKAQNDGKAIIDGEKLRRPWDMPGTETSHIHDVTIDGMIFKNSPNHVFRCGYCDRVNLKRVSAYNAGDLNDNLIGYADSTNSLIEDVVVSGGGRIAINAYQSDFITFRRVFIYSKDAFEGSVTVPDASPHLLVLYKSDDTIVENLVGTQVNKRMNTAVNDYCKQETADRNKFYASVVYDLFDADSAFKRGAANKGSGRIPESCENSEYHHLVSINNYKGFLIWAGTNTIIRNLTVVGANKADGGDRGIVINPQLTDITLDVQNSIFDTGWIGLESEDDSLVRSFTHSYNNIFNYITKYLNTQSHSTEVSINPNWNTVAYGKGAYLMQPAALRGMGEGGSNMGAEVLYQYVNGVKTATPLWPWPMEDRIFAETGVSVTWEANGGLWKTLDGVYSTTPSDSTPPAPPTGLVVE